MNQLYEAFPTVEDRTKIAKPIVVTLASIAETILYDLIVTRIQSFTREGVENIPESTLEYIRDRSIDKFGTIIDQCRKHDLLKSPLIYDQLTILSRARNRIHIQNDKNQDPQDECSLFTTEFLSTTECTVELLVRKMLELYPRVHNHVDEFEFPWEPHHPDGQN